MKPQDLVVAACLCAPREGPWTFEALAAAAGLSPSSAHGAVERLRHAGLMDGQGWSVRSGALLEFLAHGLRYVFPVQAGPETVGVPTATALPALRDELGMREVRALAWPHPAGALRGGSIEPLYPSVPVTALRDEALHEWLALIDCIRVGGTRERRGAIDALRRRLAA